ncbi:hypothetical protein [Rhodococcus opacus]|uniref:hypothetical protein n=1 Tax=Rhodococcus opacus TaxID=37919 RepID=UPI00294A36C0|nr:hypothetical protein [Rhodococcus opacus]MDV6244811.1 hypothetical protein [Rhodococcus opacus]
MPKSRGRRKGGKSRPVRRAPRQLHPADLLLRDARQLLEIDDVLTAETLASGWLGEAWSTAAVTEREPEHQLCMQVTGRACTTPSPHSLAAIDALARVAPAADRSMLTDTLHILAETQPLPAWHTVEPWTPTVAWRAVDVYDSERVLFIEYDGPRPHTLMAHTYHVGGLMIDKLAVLNPGAATTWDQLREPDEAPMPLQSAPVAEVLADLAHALRTTDMTWPRTDDEDVFDHRALAWSRCRDYLPEWPEHAGLPEQGRRQLVEDFLTDIGSDDVSRSLAELFLDYGDGYIGAGPLCWSPGEVMLLLTDWLPRKAVLDADQRNALPFVLRRWLTFALTQQGIDRQWISVVVDAVDTFLPEFHDAFDDETAWGPAKQVAAALAERGVDLTDRHAVDDAIRQLNAEQLAHRLMP